MALVTQEMIDQATTELQNAQQKLPETVFGLVYLEQEFKLPREKALAQIAQEPNDYGLDGFHVDPELKNLYLFQFQWSDARHAFQAPFQILTELGMDTAFGQGPPGIAPDQLLMQLKSSLLTYQDAIERVFVHLVFRGDPMALERSAVYEKLREELENKKYLLDQFFGRPVTLVFQFCSVEASKIGALAHQRVTHSYPLRVKGSIEMDGPSGEVMRVGFASLLDLHAMFTGMKQRFFESNIRSILSDKTPTNRSLNRAFEAIVLDKKVDPLAYAFDHNGVTLHAEKIEQTKDGFTLVEPRLLNGAQTISSFDRFLAEHAADPKLEAGKGELSELSVLCKIIADARSEFVLRVTLNNNRQNPIKPWNLHANDLIQLELQDKLGEELGVYYERQEKAFANLNEEAGEEGEGRELQEKAVELVKLAQTFLLSDGELEKSSRLQELFEDEKDYASCFNTARLQADSRHLLMAYKIQFRLGRLIREIVDKGEKKYAYLKRARGLIWALLIQALLNEEGLEERSLSYGKKLGVETAFAEWLQKMASSRVRFAIDEAAKKEGYAKKLADESLGFLRTKAFYTECMKQAKAKWGWSQKRLGK